MLPFESATQNDYFLAIVGEYFRKLEITFALEDDVVVVEDDRFGGQRLGLYNLAQSCAQTDVDAWPEFIGDHFDLMQEAFVFDQEFVQRVHDFDYARNYLSLRIYPEDYADHAIIIQRPVAPGLMAMLVFDQPHAVTNVQPDQLKPWNVELDALFELAAQNAREAYEFPYRKIEVDEVELYYLAEDHLFVANAVLDVVQGNLAPGKKGMLATLPTRHVAMFYPVDTLETVKAVGTMMRMAYEIYADGPGSISDRVFWYDGSDFHVIPYAVEDQKLQVMPPQNFVDMLGTLGA